MKKFLIACIPFLLVGCAGAPVSPAPTKAPALPPKEEKKAEVPARPSAPPPITILEAPKPPPALADIDPETLKVTYKKGADPKAFANQMVREWAAANQRVYQCAQQLEAVLKEREGKK